MKRLVLALVFGALAAGCTKQQFAVAPNSPLTVAKAEPARKADAEPEPKRRIADEPEPIEDPHLVSLDVAATNRFVEADKPAEVLARLRITTEAQPDQKRPAANVALVVDTSASMSGDAIDQARQAALAVLESLQPGDRLTVVAFHSRAEVLAPSTKIGPDTRDELRTAIESMQATGSTALAEGLAVALEELQPHVGSEVVSRIVLLSDGLPNDELPIRSLAQRAASQSIGIAALGLGVDFQETLLADIAALSGGRFHFVEDSTQVASMFKDEILHIDRVVALGATMELSMGPGVTLVDVIGQPHTRTDERTAVLRVGDLVEEESKDVVVKLRVDERRAGATVELMDARLSFTDATVGAGLLSEDAFLSVAASADKAERAQGENVAAQVVATKATTADEMLKMIAQARSGDVKGALARLKVARAAAKEVLKKSDDTELASLTAELTKLEKTLPSLAPPKPARGRRGSRPGRSKVSPTAVPYDAFGGSSSGVAPAPQQDLKRSHSKAFNALH